jgi:hypothetical protein
MVKSMYSATVYEDQLSVILKKFQTASAAFLSVSTVEDLNKIVNTFAKISQELQELTQQYTPENKNFVNH